MADDSVLLATVVALFTGRDDGAATPDDLAAALLDREDVSTVRISAHGGPSVVRIDVVGPANLATSELVCGIVRSVAGGLGLAVDVTYVGLARDDDRVVVFREGESDEVLSWGDR